MVDVTESDEVQYELVARARKKRLVDSRNCVKRSKDLVKNSRRMIENWRRQKAGQDGRGVES